MSEVERFGGLIARSSLGRMAVLSLALVVVAACSSDDTALDPDTTRTGTADATATAPEPAATATVSIVPEPAGTGPPTTTANPTTTDSSSTTTVAPSGSDGCGTPLPALDAERIVRASVESSGGTRQYLVVVPTGYDPAVPAPVAYVFHGAGSNKEQQLVYSDFRPEAEASGALLVLPDALGDPMRWSPLGGSVAGVDGVDDMMFFDDLDAMITSSWCVDPERVLVSGMSSGGFMAGSVGCLRPAVVTTIGPVTATAPPDALCPNGAPTPYVYFHGTADPVVPFDGGANSPGPVLETSQAWADHNGCVGEPTDERIGTEVIHRSWSGCTASTDLYIVEGGGHTWPGAIEVGGGHVTQDIDATAIIWDTFQSSWPT